jgi:uncharacterized protein YbdZ (MbtH family)
MSWQDSEREDTTIYKVVVNHEEQYSIWPEYKDNPLGWRDAGKVGTKAECLAYVKEVWTDMRPLSLRKQMEEMARNPPPPATPSTPPSKSLVERLAEGEHPVEAGLRPEKTVGHFKEAVDRHYVHIKFTDTAGGTELGVRLDTNACDFTQADFENGTGQVHLEGTLTLDFEKMRCIADLDLNTLTGTGNLVRVAGEAEG